MFTHTRIGFFVAFATFTASSKVRCHATRQGSFQSSAVGAGHMLSREAPCGSAIGEPIFWASGEGSAPPEGFRAIDHVEAGPWQLSADDRALIASAPGTVVLVESTFPGVVRERTRDDGWIVLAVPAADEQALAAMLLQFGADVEALEPPTLRDEVIRRLEASVHA